MRPDETAVDHELDVRGQMCPIPMIRVSQEVAKTPRTGVLRVLATDPACKADITAWARLNNAEVIRIDEADGVITLYLRHNGS
jgi:tRNA 2-thiouridine synthesizing protein A